MNLRLFFHTIPLAVFALFPACSDIEDEVFVASVGAGGVGGAGEVSSSASAMGGNGGALCPVVGAKPSWSKEWPYVVPDIDWSPDSQGFAFAASGESFTAGAFKGSIDWSNPPLLSNDSWYDVALAKFDPLGNVLWARRHIGHLLRFNLIPMSDGGVVLYGSIWGPVDFGGGPIEGEQNWFDEIIARFDTDGNHLWSRRTRLAGSGDGHLLSVARGPEDSLVVVGYFRGDVDLGTGFISTPIESPGSHDMDGFVLKIDSAGKSSWLHTYTGPGIHRIEKVSVNSAGTIGIAGVAAPQSVWDDGPLASDFPSDRAAIIAQLDKDGNQIFGRWLKDPDAPNTTASTNGLLVRPDNSMLVLASFAPIPFDQPAESKMQKWKSSGQLEWSVQDGKTLAPDASIVFAHFPPFQPNNQITTVVRTMGLVDMGFGECDTPQWFLLTHELDGTLSKIIPWHWSTTQGPDNQLVTCTSSPTPCGEVSCPGCTACCVFTHEP